MRTYEKLIKLKKENPEAYERLIEMEKKAAAACKCCFPFKII